MVCKLVAYYRVSTEEQGESGLGLEAQGRPSRPTPRPTGCVVVGEYTEVESGKRADRPELARASPTPGDRGPPWSSPSSTASPAMSPSWPA